MSGKVYILGAGASHYDTLHLDVPLPLATQFFYPRYIKEHWGHDLNLPDLEASSLIKVIRHYFGVDIINANNDVDSQINIEEIYSFIEHALSVFPGRFYERKILTNAKHELLHYIENVVRYTPWSVEKPFLHNSIINNLEENDNIITFNWDLIVDRVLEESGDKFKLIEGQKKLINPYQASSNHYQNVTMSDNYVHGSYLLKLHGSLNLVACTNKECTYSQIPYRFSLKEETLDMWTCVCCGHPVDIMILPPHMNKTYTHNKFVQLQANVAAQKLSVAESIIIIGYSFPVFDYQASMLIRMARMEPWQVDGSQLWLNKVVVVDKQANKESYINRIKELLGINDAISNYGHEIEFETHTDIGKYLNEN